MGSYLELFFIAFCQEKTRTYKTTTSQSAQFMCCSTWIKVFFWIAALKIDFRKEIDPWCRQDPSVLACDGTHIGVSVRLLDLKPPVEQTDKAGKVPQHHNRYTTCRYLHVFK